MSNKSSINAALLCEKWDVENWDPTMGQTEEGIEAFLASCREGSEVVIRTTYGGVLGFALTTVNEVGRGNRKAYIYTAAGAPYGGFAWFRKSGKNARSPGGQARLVEPTPQIREFIEKNPRGRYGYVRSWPHQGERL